MTGGHLVQPAVGPEETIYVRPRNLVGWAAVDRLSVSVEPEHLAVLRTVAAAHGTTVSAVVRAAAEALADDNRPTGEIRRRIKPDARGGARPGAGRPRRRSVRAA